MTTVFVSVNIVRMNLPLSFTRFWDVELPGGKRSLGETTPPAAIFASSNLHSLFSVVPFVFAPNSFNVARVVSFDSPNPIAPRC